MTTGVEAAADREYVTDVGEGSSWFAPLDDDATSTPFFRMLQPGMYNGRWYLIVNESMTFAPLFRVNILPTGGV